MTYAKEYYQKNRTSILRKARETREVEKRMGIRREKQEDSDRYHEEEFVRLADHVELGVDKTYQDPVLYIRPEDIDQYLP